METKGIKRGREEPENSNKITPVPVASTPGAPPTATEYIIPSSQFTSLPPELKNVDFTKRISWRKFCPYNNEPLPLTPINTKPSFTTSSNNSSSYPKALDFHIHASHNRARATTIHFPRNHRSVPTPIFMPVGTKGSIKSLTTHEISSSSTPTPSTFCPIILGNTYHLALQPGTELIKQMGGLHKYINWNNGSILTDSGGFQMVSLLKLAEIMEEGVTFDNPFEQKDEDENENYELQNDIGKDQSQVSKSTRMLLRPEDSIYHQNNIGSDIIMALDDVVSSTTINSTRFQIATYRTLRWLDRCISSHSNPQFQNLFAIVQGGLDTTLGGLRDQCLAGFQCRDDKIPGYAIGGLAGGEEKDDFWKVVDLCCKALPDDKPRYLMGVGYPLDLVVCTALGVDMYDCVYPTRTARFGVALVRGDGISSSISDTADERGARGTLRLKSNEFYNDDRIIMDGCKCQACSEGFTRSQLHTLLKRGNPLATSLMTSHNIAFMMSLVGEMRQAILEQKYDKFVIDFVNEHFMGKYNGGEDVPKWVFDALEAAGINLEGKLSYLK